MCRVLRVREEFLQVPHLELELFLGAVPSVMKASRPTGSMTLGTIYSGKGNI